AWAVLCEGERRFRPWMLSYLGVGLAVIAVHVAVRATWTSGGTSSHIAFSAPELASALASVVGGFASLPMTAGGLPGLLGLAAAVFTLAWIGSEPHAGPALRAEGARVRRARTSRGHGPPGPEASRGSASTGGSGAGSVAAPHAPKASPAIGAFLALAITLGLAPMVVGNLWAISVAHPYYAFPAVPWISLAAARSLRRAPVAGLRIGLTALVALNVC